MQRRPILLSTLAAAALLGGCESLQRTDSFMGLVTPYRIDIVQGNAITREQAALLKPGLTRLQVRDILGTPLIADPFHADRWDYVFTLRRPNTDAQRRGVVVLFEGDVVKSVEATELPTEREFVAEYAQHLLDLAPVEGRRLTVVVDAGNGMAGHTADAVLS
ncbi:MAG: outer membrane protein assembly factor BamE, partial [Rubrivivax sp.]|nr:outer membrane protein assembly factor BamE [Rubrivivax sp.]